MPRTTFTEGEYYHVFNRGVEKRAIFMNDKDRWRFLTLLLILQGDVIVPKVSKIVLEVQHWRLDNEIFKEILKDRQVDLVSFCLMTNHYHFILSEIKEGGISKFMMRLGNSYTKYFNLAHERKGHLFEGKFQSIHIDQNEYLNYLSAYIHLNPHEFQKWRGQEDKYPWSSFQDYCGNNRLDKFLNLAIIMEQFNNRDEYRTFVKETLVKEHVPDEYCIDSTVQPWMLDS